MAWGSVKRKYKKEGDKWVKKQTTNSHVVIANTLSGTTRTTWEGKEFLVVPVIALTEGVHTGSAGPALYLVDEFGKYIEAWNGSPLPVLHPQRNGIPISANSPEIISEQSVGWFFNAKLEDKKLKGELWIDTERAQRIAPEVIDLVQRGRLEVSTGLWSEDELTSGNWDGKDYDSIIRNIRPDHLALLPGGTGA